MPSGTPGSAQAHCPHCSSEHSPSGCRRASPSGCRGEACCLAAYAGGVAWLFSLALVDGEEGIGTILEDPYEYLRTARQTVGPPRRAARVGQPHPLRRPAGQHRERQLAGARRRTPTGGAELLRASRPGRARRRPAGRHRGDADRGIDSSRGDGHAPAARGNAVARRAAPFLVFGPAAIWQSVSADAMFAAVAAWGIAALAAAAVRRSIVWALVAGTRPRVRRDAVLRAAPARPARCRRAGGRAQLAAAPVGGPRSARGGAHLCRPRVRRGGRRWPVLQDRYWDGVAKNRPPSYWMWANLAALAFCAGPMLGAGLTTLGPASPRHRRRPRRRTRDEVAGRRGRRDGARRRRVADEQGRGRTDLAAVRAVAADLLCAAARAVATDRAGAPGGRRARRSSTCCSPAGERRAVSLGTQRNGHFPTVATRGKWWFHWGPSETALSELRAAAARVANSTMPWAGCDGCGEAQLARRRGPGWRRCGVRRRGGSRRSPRAADHPRRRRAARRPAGSRPGTRRQTLYVVHDSAGREFTASIASRLARATSWTCTKSRICPPSSKTRGALPASREDRKIAATPE